MIKLTETITAISTAMSDSGIGIVRMSGPEAFEIADRSIRGRSSFPVRRAILFITVGLRMGKIPSMRCL